MRNTSRFLFCLLSTTMLLSACEDLPEWMGGGDDKPPIQGTRVAVMADVGRAKPDEALAGMAVTVPEAQNNTSWQQQGGSATGANGNFAVSGFTHHDTARVGDGNAWKQYGNISPVVAAGKIFAMDAHGYISAHDASRIDSVSWTSKTLVEADEPDVMGGGLAVDGGQLFVASGYGKVAAFDAATGEELWKTTIGVPLRNAPKVSAGKVFVLSVDNQLFALDAAQGKQLWNHSGINENVGFVTSVAPSVKDNVVLAPYSSGEIHALDAATGQELWSDTLILSRHTTATGGFSGIGGAPVIADDTVYAGDSGGFFAALSLSNGRRVWEQDISTLNSAWVAGDFVYLLSDTNELVCLLKADGRVKWARQLPRFENETKRKNPYVWHGPVLAGGQLLMAGQHGEMLVISPKDGTVASKVEIPDMITDAPVVAGGKLYFITQDARLHTLY